jgi:hypothetical protein
MKKLLFLVILLPACRAFTMNSDNGNATATTTVVQQMTAAGGGSGDPKPSKPTTGQNRGPCCLCCLKLCLGFDPTSYADDE